ncbi:MAG: hypothetical protein H6985_14975 [Pseudomonadales bacterium]|nr:hypothetical protein [Pseudomonadales bacterium]
MQTEGLSVPSMSILALMYLLSLNACVSTEPTSVEARTAGPVTGAAAATQNDTDTSSDTEVRGNYETGFWFDRELFFVWVTANSADEAERVARLTAMDSCSKRDKFLKIVYTKDWQERRLFIPVKVDRFSYEIRFRCATDVEKPSRVATLAGN